MTRTNCTENNWGKKQVSSDYCSTEIKVSNYFVTQQTNSENQVSEIIKRSTQDRAVQTVYRIKDLTNIECITKNKQSRSANKSSKKINGNIVNLSSRNPDLYRRKKRVFAGTKNIRHKAIINKQKTSSTFSSLLENEAERLAVRSILPEPLKGSCDIINFCFRCPDGALLHRRFGLNQSLLDLIQYLHVEGYHTDDYRVILNFPRRHLTALNHYYCLRDLNLHSQEMVFLEE